MSNENLLESRMRSLRDSLMSLYNSDIKSASETKGLDREYFIQHFLRIILPSHIKIFKGIIMDKNTNQTNQVDLIIQSPYGFSIPPLIGDTHVCIAESVACVIEIKSNLQTEWDKILKKSKEIKQLEYSKLLCKGYNIDSNIRIPFIAIGYEGFNDFSEFNEKINNITTENKKYKPDVIFQIDKCFIYSNYGKHNIYTPNSESMYGFFQLIIIILYYLNKIKDKIPDIDSYLSGKWFLF